MPFVLRRAETRRGCLKWVSRWESLSRGVNIRDYHHTLISRWPRGRISNAGEESQATRDVRPKME